MALEMEQCSAEEVCGLMGQTKKSLDEIRERLQDWLKSQKHLPQDMPKSTMENFIIATKMSLEQAKQKLDMYYTMRTIVPDLLRNRDPLSQSIIQARKLMLAVFLPKLTPEKYRICIMRPNSDDYTNYDAYESAKYVLMMQDYLMSASSSTGCIIICDHTMLTFAFVAKWTPTLIKKGEIVMKKAFAQRIKGIYIINPVRGSETVMKIAKTVMKPKLAARVLVFPGENYEGLFDYVPKSILPREYGGDERPLTELADSWAQTIEEKRDWFLEQDKLVVNENLRQGPSLKTDDLFGITGSFRKLDID
ncbi:retinol-binding protein pinta-like isoform X1 [Athalia rosae]|uniref:retinol-binding protein pinta-like isoform X1 n=2 Tax=Athalia rosae TaxID=37344 RepID=UPI0020336DCC|nr:retinol-binding protein pinta-like isoform X1 [Athalia rosae]